MSSFHGLEMAKQALFAQRAALNTTGHNISNANTEGYSRQRVNFESASPYPVPGLNRPGMTGQMGTGVETGIIERIRNQFLDLQYRAENSKSGYWESKSDALHRLEQLMDEPSKSGVSHTMNQLWESLEELSADPDSTGAKSVVAQRSEAFANALNYAGESIESQRGDLKDEMGYAEKKVNSLIRQINDINEQVKQVETHGDLPNDLYDKRDRLIDELSGIVSIKVSYEKSSDRSLDIADGIATIELADSHGKSFGSADENTVLLDGETGEIQELNVSHADMDAQEAVSIITVGEQEFKVEDFQAKGSLMGHIHSYGYLSENGDVEGTHPELLDDMNKMAAAFVSEFNEEYRTSDKVDDEFSFFIIDEDTHGVKVNDKILDEPASIVASDEEYGDMASKLAEVFETSLEDLNGTSVNKYYESIIGDIGIKAQEANRMAENMNTLRSQVHSKRSSVSDVSLDEEMTNMIKFQHAYNAAARSMTTTDEMLDRIINNMGLVGR